ncbi:MAG: hypothetical protein HYZ53_08885 [Planctomycetes bacterium]|nr:hypothetical protein [Planctomycetota bacterium]
MDERPHARDQDAVRAPVHVGKQLTGTDRVALEAVAHYLVHPPVVLGRILSEGTAEKILYKADAVHPRHGGNFRVSDPLDSIPLRSRLRASFGGQVPQVVCHIPDAHEKSRLFYGFYSARARGWRRMQGVVTGAASAVPGAVEVDESDRAPLSVRRRWAHLIRKVGACPERAERVEGRWIPWSVPAAGRR